MFSVLFYVPSFWKSLFCVLVLCSMIFKMFWLSKFLSYPVPVVMGHRRGEKCLLYPLFFSSFLLFSFYSSTKLDHISPFIIYTYVKKNIIYLHLLIKRIFLLYSAIFLCWVDNHFCSVKTIRRRKVFNFVYRHDLKKSWTYSFYNLNWILAANFVN